MVWAKVNKLHGTKIIIAKGWHFFIPSRTASTLATPRTGHCDGSYYRLQNGICCFSCNILLNILAEGK